MKTGKVRLTAEVFLMKNKKITRVKPMRVALKNRKTEKFKPDDYTIFNKVNVDVWLLIMKEMKMRINFA